MSIIDEPHSESPAPEELVAYLDGELSPDECRLVEERLAVDADYRQQLRDLDQAWEALDSLPSTAVDDDFARTTIEMVTLAAQEEQGQRASEVATTSRRQRLAWALGGIAMVAASFLAGRWLLPSADTTLLVDLPVIRQVDLLAEINDIEFLRRLAKEGLVERMATDAGVVDQEVFEIEVASDPSFAARRKWVESQSADRKADLAAQQNRFEQLLEEERRRRHDLERDITKAADAAVLQRTMSAYGQWLSRQTSSERSRLRNLATNDERVDRVREIMQREDRLATQKISPADAETLRREISAIYNERREDFLKATPQFESDVRHRRLTERPKMMTLVVVMWALRNPDTGEQTMRRIVDKLSPAAQEQLPQLARPGSERRGRNPLWHWMQEAMRPEREPGDVDSFFANDLNDEDRERLLSLPKDEMEAELERMLLGSQFGQRGTEWFGGFDRPGPPPGEGPFRGPPGGRFGPPPPDGPGHRGGEGFDRGRRGPGPDRRPDGRPRPDRSPLDPPPPPRDVEIDDPA